MNNWQIISLCALGFLLIICLINRKVWTPGHLCRQIKVFWNQDGSKRVLLGIFDIFCFMFCPFGMAALIIWPWDYSLSKDVVMVLLTVFSILFSILFAVISIVGLRKDFINETDKRVNEETITTIQSASLLSLITVVLLVVYQACLDCNLNSNGLKWLSFVVISLAINQFMLLLLITKRLFSSLHDQSANGQ